jgi:hypothetical protein
MKGSVVKPERYLVVKGTAGMGNRICCAISGLLYARLTNRRLYIDWNDRSYSDDGCNVFPLLFDHRRLGMADTLPDIEPVYPPAWRGRLQMTMGAITRLVCPGDPQGPAGRRRSAANLARLHYPQPVLVFWSFQEQIHRFRRPLARRFPEFRGRTVREILGHSLRQDLRPVESIQERVAAFRKDHLPEPVVGVHVRYTDKKTSLPLVEQTLDRLLARQPGLTVFLATDSAEVAERFQGRFPRVVTPARQYAPSGRPAHRAEGEIRRLEHAVETLVDLYLLAGCEYLILDERSTFSYLAHLLSPAAEDRIVTLFDPPRLHPRIRHLLWTIKRSLRPHRCTPSIRPASEKVSHAPF